MKWFILQNDEVSGPFSKEKVLEQSTTNSLIWGTQLSEWLTLEDWTEFIATKKNLPPKRQVTQWHYALGDESFGPFTKEEFVKTLKKSPDLKLTLVWHKGLPGWEKFYDHSDLVSAVGEEARTLPRYEINELIMATPVVQNESPPTFMCKAVSISEGGLGISGFPEDMPLNGEFNLSLDFLNPEKGANIRGKIVSHSKSAANIAFSSLQGELLSLLVSYIKSLEEQDSSDKKIAA